MPELPTCECISGFPPYDRLTFIYQAAAELSGDTSLPSADCVAGVPPFSRFAYIYAAFRVIAEDDSLPSQECVEGEPFQDQVTRIYQAVFAYAGDAGLPSVECVRGTPLWQQWVNIYAALYSAAGAPDELTNPTCIDGSPDGDILSAVYCALIAGCVTPTLESATILSNGTTVIMVFSVVVTGDGTGFLVSPPGDAGFLTYTSGSGTTTLQFEMDIEATEGAATLDYAPGNIANGDCPLAAFTGFEMINNVGNEFFYLRPDGVSRYLRPDGVSFYIRP